MSKTCRARKDSEKFSVGKFEGSLAGVGSVRAVLPAGWRYSYTNEGPEIIELRLTDPRSNESFTVPNTTFVVVSIAGALELHDESSFEFLYRESEEFEEDYEFQISIDPGYLWGG